MAAPALSFGKPSAGWLPVRLEVDGKAIEFAASDVADDPLEQLCNSLLDVAAGRRSKTEWFLEPDCYEFNFIPSEGQVILEVELVEKRASNQEDLPEKRSQELRWSGSPGALVLSFWRALKKSQSNFAGEAEWLPFPIQIFSRLEQRAREFKNEA
jgi:hypothetical protein